MCGIAGIISFNSPVDARTVKAMTDAIAHRGPDASGVQDLGPVVLGHRRLSIIDTAESNNQPLSDLSGDFWISFNGEIYNFQEIKNRLVALGSKFRTKGDTEVILEAYKQWGVDCVEQLHGMFAFALWDVKKERLLLARDRMGEKPLFYYRLPGGGLVFASEPHALLCHKEVAGNIDPHALGQYLSLNYTIGEKHLIAGVRRLPPGHFMLVSENSQPEPRRYWDLAASFKNKKEYKSEAEAADELARLIDRSVNACLISDVPVGAFLSGGIDSSTVVASMLKSLPAKQVRTFTIGFGEQSFDEVDDARLVADSLKVDHSFDIIAPDMESLMKNFIKAAAEPVADSSFLPTYLLAKFARQSITVALSGDGGDECFAGYETYAADRLHKLLSWIPGWAGDAMSFAAHKLVPVSHGKVSFDYKLRQFLSGLSYSSSRAHYSWRNIFSPQEKALLMTSEWRGLIKDSDPYNEVETFVDEVDGCHYIDQAMYIDMKTFLPDDILVKVDRATMAHGLESRAPFLDHRLIEFAASLPVNYKLKGLRKKHILKESQKHRLPMEIIEKRKQGFSAPVASWLDGPLKKFADDVLCDSSMSQWFDLRQIEILQMQHRRKEKDNGHKLFGLLCFGLWLDSLKGSAKIANAALR